MKLGGFASGSPMVLGWVTSALFHVVFILQLHSTGLLSWIRQRSRRKCIKSCWGLVSEITLTKKSSGYFRFKEWRYRLCSLIRESEKIYLKWMNIEMCREFGQYSIIADILMRQGNWRNHMSEKKLFVSLFLFCCFLSSFYSS